MEICHFVLICIKLKDVYLHSRLADALSDIDLSTCAVTSLLRNSLKAVIEDHMEPKGFAADIFLEQLHLLDHLKALFASLQVTSVFSSVLFSKVRINVY